MSFVSLWFSYFVSSYEEACLFVRYLVDNYGLDAVLSIALAETYEFGDYFGISRDEAFVNFLAKVQGNQ